MPAEHRRIYHRLLLVGFVAGLVVLVAVVSTGIALIMLKQRKGLHTKKDGRGVYIYAHSKKL